VHELLKKYQNIIRKYRIILWEAEPSSFRFKAEILFTDHSTLFIREYRFAATRKYVYQWQDRQNNLKVRWDNAPHWKSLATFPHHKHIGSKMNVVGSTELFLEDVMRVIYQEISGKQK